MITVSEKASIYIEQLIQKDGQGKNTFVRVGVKSGGCSGLEYQLAFDHQLNEGDQVFEDRGIQVVVNKKNLLYLFGTELDYSDGLGGKGLYFLNPNAARTCSCGESFSL
ncbi:MAG TPA: iron-sulfur cluster assembly accessory protein [Chitinophagaceae bacterium]|nr:iron-sulfur cluster assembly accessory protein [Chitinophagaceae bacterium]